MSKECRHIMPSGSKCKSPALRESAFCYHHVNLRRATAPKGVFDSIMLPPLEDSCGLQIALHEVLDAIVHQRIDSKRAGLLLYGLQIAAQLNARRTEVLNPVRDVCHDSDGNTLAPEETACDPAEDSHDSPHPEPKPFIQKPCQPERSGFLQRIEGSAFACRLHDNEPGCPIHDVVSSRHEWEISDLNHLHQCHNTTRPPEALSS